MGYLFEEDDSGLVIPGELGTLAYRNAEHLSPAKATTIGRVGDPGEGPRADANVYNLLIWIVFRDISALI